MLARLGLTILIGLAIVSSLARAEPPDEKPSRRTDLYGDPLPDGAIARLGTGRLRHTDDVLSLAYSPDSEMIASGGRDNVICLWDAKTGKEVGRLTGPEHWLNHLAFSPDGTLLAASSHDEVTQIWNVSKGKRLFKVQGNCVVFAPDGKTLATGSKDKLIRLWRSDTGKEQSQLAGHESEVLCLTFSSDGKTLASGSKDGSARLWNVATGKQIQKLGGHQNGVHSIAFALDGKRLGLASNGTLQLYDTATGKRVFELGNPKVGVGDVIASPVANAFATSYGGGIRLWDAATGKELSSLASESWDWHDEVRCLAVSHDGKRLVCGSMDSRICQFDLTSGREVLLPNSHQNAIRDIAVAPDGKTIATASGDRTVRLWETTTAKELKVLRGHKYGLRRVAFSPDGRILASCGRDDMVILWDWATGKELRRMPGLSVAFSPDGRILAAGSHVGEGNGTYRAGLIHFYDPATGKELQRLIGHHRPVTHVVFSPDGRMLASIEDEPFPLPGRDPPKPEASSIRLWDVASGKEWQNFGEGHAEGPLVFSADGKTLASASKDNDRLLFWEVATGKERHQIRCKPYTTWLVAFAADGRTFATAGIEPPIRVHAWPTGKELGQFEGRGGSVYALTFAPDGAALVSGGQDTTAIVWNLTSLKRPTPEPSRELTREQLQQLWADLGRDDAVRAFSVISTIAAAHGRSEAYVKEQLRPARIDRERVTKLIADLDNERYAERNAAEKDLTAMGGTTVPFLQQAIRAPPSAEARRRLERLLTKALKGPLPLPQVQELRALEVLELLGTSAARQVLETLTKGDSEARLTREAKTALQRLEKRPAK
jgi:WD40 repeat protein